jgi:hypothetical protein
MAAFGQGAKVKNRPIRAGADWLRSIRRSTRYFKRAMALFDVHVRCLQ